MSAGADEMYDLAGRRFRGNVRVTLRPGFGISGPNGEHLEGGPHVLPLPIAHELVRTNRADFVAPDAEAESPEHGDPMPEHADPSPQKRGRR